MWNAIKTVILFLWCLPQNILGFFVWLFNEAIGAQSATYKGAVVTRWNYGGGISLGIFIFVPIYSGGKTLQHEYGHTRQGYRLGWLYLLIIGLPSIIWAGCFGNYRKKHEISYYAFYTEKWADKLGGVER